MSYREPTCVNIRSKNICEPDCVLPDGTIQKECLGCPYREVEHGKSNSRCT